MIRWEEDGGRLTAYLGAQQVAHVHGLAHEPFWFPVSIIAQGDDPSDPRSAKSVGAAQAVEDYVRAWLQDAGLVSAPWLRASVEAYWEKRGGSPRAGGVE